MSPFFSLLTRLAGFPTDHEPRRDYRRGKGLESKASLPRQTDLQVLGTCGRMLVVLDYENLLIGLRNHHRCQPCLGRLLEAISRLASRVKPIAAFTSERHSRKAQELRRAGWQVTTIAPERIRQYGRWIPCPNLADNRLLFLTGLELARHRFDSALLISGDGTWSTNLGAALIAHSPPGFRVFSLSLPGSTSQRILKRRDLFAGHAFLGRDLVAPLGALRQPFAHC
jgi:hypothetical protein